MSEPGSEVWAFPARRCKCKPVEVDKGEQLPGAPVVQWKAEEEEPEMKTKKEVLRSNTAIKS